MKSSLLVLAAVFTTFVANAAPVFLDGPEAVRYVEGLEKHAAKMKTAVLESRSVYPQSDNTVYVAANGDDGNDGLSQERPIASLKKVNALPLKPGSVVLFRRGDLFRGQLKVRAGVTYSAYGTGPKPTLCRSMRDYADPALWCDSGIAGVWRCTLPIANAGVITFDHDPNDPKELGRYDVLTARLRHSRGRIESPRHLEKDLEFWSDLDKKILYLRSEQNPGTRFKRIEIGEGETGVCAGSERDVTIDNLHITLAGCHGVGAGTTVNLEVRNCLFDWIGGSLLIPEGKKGGPCRFGNAVEVYGGCDGYRVHDNWMYQIYDTGITHQCHHAKNQRIFQKNVEHARNLIEYCFWSIEYYNAFNGYGETRDVHVHHNFCRFGGEGWGCVGRAGGTPMFSIDDRPDVTSNYVNEANVLQHSRGILVNNFGRHAPEMQFQKNVYVQPRGWKFANIGDLNRNGKWFLFDESAAEVMREAFGETDGTYVFIPDPDKVGVKTIACWGDSITEGMAMKRTETYPARLQAMLGKGFRVLNAGDGGEDVVTIPARQGCLPLTTASKISFAAGERKVLVGTGDDNGFHTPDGRKIKLTAALGREIPVNPVKIGNDVYKLSFTDFKWNTPGHPISYKLWLERADAASAVEIPAGTPAVFSSVAAAKDAYCEVFLMGANGGWNNQIEKLIAGYRQMIARRGANKPYLVIVPYWGGFTQAQADAFKAAFGDHAVDFRGEAVARGLKVEGIQPTAQDEAEMKKGRVPPSLLYRNRPDCHMNPYGYDFLARLVHERGKALGYW